MEVLRRTAANRQSLYRQVTLAEQKQHLVELLDKNQLYVNLSSLNDRDFAVSVEDKKVTQDFYQLKK